MVIYFFQNSFTMFFGKILLWKFVVICDSNRTKFLLPIEVM